MNPWKDVGNFYMSGNQWTGCMYWAAKTTLIPAPPARLAWREPARPFAEIATETASKRSGRCRVVRRPKWLTVSPDAAEVIAVQAGGLPVFVNAAWFRALDHHLGRHGKARLHARRHGNRIGGHVVWVTPDGEPIGLLLSVLAGVEAP